MAATPVIQSTGNLAAQNGTASLPATANVTNSLCGFSVTGGGATAASIVQVTITGLIGGIPLAFQIAVPQGANNGISTLIVNFPTAIPASAQNSPIVLNMPSFGAGNTNAVGNIWGFFQ